MNPSVILRDFWPSSSIGHHNFYGEDVTKLFLMSLFEDLNFSNIIYIDSNSRKKTIFEKLFDKYQSWNKPNVKQKIAYEQRLSLKKKDKSRYVWYTPENIRPPLYLDYNIFLSHDLESYGDRNIYLPFWATRLSKTLAGARNYQLSLLNKRHIQSEPKKLACAIISNPDPVRMEFIKLLSRYGQVDIFGKLGKSIDNKMNILEEYRFNICFENSLFPGYVTEKPLESWLAGCIPVWYGLDAAGFLNSRAMINVAKLGFQKSIEQIIKINAESPAYSVMRNEPFLVKGFDFEALSSNLSSLLKG